MSINTNKMTKVTMRQKYKWLYVFHISSCSSQMQHSINSCLWSTICLCFYSKLAHWEDTPFLKLLCWPNAQLMFRQGSSHSTRLLWPQVFWYVPTFLVPFAKILLLCLVNDSQNASYRLSHHATTQKNSKNTKNSHHSLVKELSRGWLLECCCVNGLLSKITA